MAEFPTQTEPIERSNPFPISLDWLEPCRGNPERLVPWLKADSARLAACLLMICLGGGLYGASLGLMRGPLQALYSSIKIPLLLVSVMTGNALLNGMMGQLLGLRLSFRESFMAILLSFTIFSLLLGSLAPVALYLLWTLPLVGEASANAYNSFLWMHTLFIAFAGVLSNLRLLQVLNHLCADPVKSRHAMFCWLFGNLLLGSQLSWLLRPFFGTPNLPTEFVRANAFDRNFFEALFAAWQQMF